LLTMVKNLPPLSGDDPLSSFRGALVRHLFFAVKGFSISSLTNSHLPRIGNKLKLPSVARSGFGGNLTSCPKS